MSVYDILGHRLALARSKHPQGASFDALLSEVGEVADERLAGNRDRERDELLDVAVVAIRLYLGETWAPF